MFSAHNVSKYIVNWCHDNGVYITNLKLQKLLYFVQGRVSKCIGRRFIEDDFYAWKLGPVVPSVYSEYALYSSTLIPRQFGAEIFDNDICSQIDRVLYKYKSFSAWELVDLSHEEDPWKYNYMIFGDKSIIPYESIADFYGVGNC